MKASYATPAAARIVPQQQATAKVADVVAYAAGLDNVHYKATAPASNTKAPGTTSYNCCHKMMM
jgi:hypothetical protein